MSGNSHLLLAVNESNLPLLEALIKIGASLNVRDKDSCTALLIGARSGSLEIVKCLLENNACIEDRDQDGNTPLLIASDCGHQDLVSLFLEMGSSLEERNEKGETCMHFAIKGDRMEVLKQLLENGASVNEIIGCDETPLSIAAMNGKLDLVKWLHDNGADITSSKSGKDSLFYHIGKHCGKNGLEWWYEKNQEYSSEDFVELLSHYINDSMYNEIVEYLLYHKEDEVLQYKFNGNNILLQAVKNNNIPLVKILLKHKKISPNELNEEGESIFTIIKEKSLLDELEQIILDKK